MADANVDSVQQSQDAQNLDNLTSLQQADSTTAPQPTGGTADATVTTTNPPAPDTPSLYNDAIGTNNNQTNLEAAGTNSLLDTTTFTNNGGATSTTDTATTSGAGAFGTEVNTGNSPVQYTVINEAPVAQGTGTNSTQNTVGGTQGGVAAAGALTTEGSAAATTSTTNATTTPTDAPITNATPTPTLNANGTPVTDPTVDPLITDPTPQEPVSLVGSTTVTLNDVTVNEAGSIIYTASLDNPPTSIFTVTLSNGVVITFAPESLIGFSEPQPPRGEDIYVDGEIYTVAIKETAGGNFEKLDTSSTATVNVKDTIDTTTIKLTQVTSGNENGYSVTYTATLQDASNNPVVLEAGKTVTVDVIITDPNGGSTTETITINGGSSSGNATTFSKTDADPFIENESLSARLDATSITSTEGNLEKLVVDASPVEFKIADVEDTTTIKLTQVTSGNENGYSVTYTATLQDASNNPVVLEAGKTVTVDVIITDPNGGSTTETITINGGSSSGNATTFSKTDADPFIENESLSARLDATSITSTEGNLEKLVVDASPVEFKIADVEDTTTIKLTQVTSGNENGYSVTYTATLQDASNNPVVLEAGKTVTVDVIITDPNGGSTTETITINGGSSSGNATTFSKTDADPFIENESLSARLDATSITSTEGNLEKLVVDASPVEFKIADVEDTTTIKLTQVTSGNENGYSVTYTATLQDASNNPVVLEAGKTVTVDVIITDPNGGSTTETITINGGSSSGNATTFSKTDADPFIENESLSARLDATSITSTEGNLEKLVVDASPVEFKIADVEDTTTIKLTQVTSGNENGYSVTYTATLQDASNNPVVLEAGKTVTVDVIITDPNGGSTTETITINGGSSSGNATTFSKTDADPFIENESLSARLDATSITSTEGNLEKLVVDASPVEFKIADVEDTTTIKLTQVTSGNENGYSVTYTATLQDASNNPVVLEAGKTVTVDVIITDPNGGSTTETITINGGSSSGNATTFSKTDADPFIENESLSARLDATSITSTEGNLEKLVVDASPVEFKIADVEDTTTIKLTQVTSGNENGYSVTYTATLQDASNNPVVLEAGKTVTVDVIITDPNGGSTTETITINGGSSSGNATTFSKTDADPFIENESLSARLDATSITSTEGNLEKLVVDASPVEFKIADVEDTTTIKLTQVTSGNENGYSVTYTATLQDASNNPVVLEAGKTVTVDVIITDPNGGSTTETITINGGSSSGNATTFSKTDADPFIENESLSARLDATSITSTEGNLEKLVVDASPVEFKIADVEDTTTIKLTQVTSGNENGYSVTYTATLQDASNNPVVLEAGKTVTVDVIITDPNGGSTTETITINGGSSSGNATTFSKTDADPFIENESLSARLDATSITSTEGNLEKLVVDASPVEFKIADVEDTTTIKLTQVTSGNENGYSVTYTATLQDASNNPVVLEAGKTVTVDVIITDPNGGSTTETITINGGSSSGNATTFSKTDADPFIENESLSARLDATSITSTEGNLEKLVVDASPVEFKIADVEDTTTIKLTQVTSGNENGYSVTYTATLQDASNNPVVLEAGKTVTVDVIITDPNGGSTTETITINGGSSSGNATTFSKTDADPFIENESLSARLDATSITSTEGNLEKLVVDASPVEFKIADVEDTTTIKLLDPDPVRDGTSNVTIVAEVDNVVSVSPLVITLSNGATITIPVGEKIGVSTPFAEDVTVASGQTTGSKDITIASVSGGNYEALNTTDKATIVVQTPELTLYKSAIVTDIGGDFGANRSGNALTGFSGQVDSVNDVISYTLTLKNTGAVALNQVVVYDQLFKDAISVNLFDDSTSATPTSLSVKAVTTEGVVSYFVELPESLPIGVDYLIKYDYVVTLADVNKGYIENTAVIDSDLTNPLAISDQTKDYGNTDGVAYSQVGVANLYDVGINKYANANAVNGVGSLIEYKIYVTNEGIGTLSGVKVSDKMFASASDQSGTEGKQISAELHTLRADGGYDVTNIFYTIGGDGLLNVGTLAYGQYAVITYEHIVTNSDYTIFQEGIQKSIFDYANIGDKLDQVEFSYGTFDAYVNKIDADPYSTVVGEKAKLFFNVDNTGVAVGVNAGVMAGDRNGNSDHLRAVFNPNTLNGGKSVIEGVSIAFTNAKDVELAFKASYGDPGHLKTFNGSIVIGSKGSVTLREIDGTDPSSYQLNGFSSKSGSTYSFVGPDMPNGWFTVTEASGPGGAQNKIYTLNFTPDTNFVNSFDFSVVGDAIDNSADQIKVVDVKFDSINFTASSINNTATVYSNEDDSSNQSDEIATNSVLVTSTVGSGLAGIIDTDITAPIIAEQSFTYSEGKGSVSAVIANIAASDNVKVTAFRFSDSKSSISADGFYQINNNGEITLTTTGLTSTANDFEAGAPAHTLGIEAKDAAGNWSISKNIVLTEANVNDNLPVLSDSNTAQANSVAENASVGATVGLTVLGVDADVPTGAMTYSLTNDAGGKFAINSAGVVTVASALDYETAQSHTITVQATSSDGSIATKDFVIGVTNVNDNLPVLSDSNTAQANSVAENASVGATVGLTVLGVDADVPTGAMTYSLTNDAGGKFAINSAGVVTVASALDYETAQSHTITVQATSSDGSIATKDFVIGVTNVNDNLPVLSDSNTAQANSVAENASVGATVGLTVLGVDADVPTGAMTYSLTNDAGGKFAINSAGVVTVASALDYETAQSHTITVQATSSDGSIATKDFVIGVTNVNDNLPVLSDSNTAQANSVAENASVGATVGLTVLGVDADVPTGAMTYSLTNDAGGKFAINSAGVVTVASALDYETAQSHTITVQATSSDGSIATKDFVIGVTNVNDNLPVLSDSNTAQANSVAENASVGATVGLTVLGVDADVPTGAMTYSLTNDAGGKFAINSAGVVTVASALDYETAQSHTITVQATSSDGSIATKDFVIGVTNVNDNLPVLSDSNTAQANSVAENASVGATVGLTVLGVDADVPTGAMTYSLTNDAGGKFAINSAGVVTVASALDYETAQSHTITVQATSSDGSIATKDFVIGVTNVNDNLPVLSDSNTAQANSVAENASVGATVGLTVLGVDADVPTGAMTYSLTNDAGGKFAIDAVTGIVTVSGSLVGTSGTSQTLTVKAVSADGSEASLNFAVNVTAPIDRESTGSISVSTSASSKIVSFTSSFSDADSVAAGKSVTITKLQYIDASNSAVLQETAGYATYDSASGKSSYYSNDIKIKLYLSDGAGGVTQLETAAFKPTSATNTALVFNTSSVDPLLKLTTLAAPIAIDLGNDGVHYLTSSSGVGYDYNHDGIVESTAWVAPEDGLLALQKEDGTHNIVFSTQAGETDLIGLAKVYDSNKDGVLDAKDADFAKFGVWQDANSDGIVQNGEFLTLADRGITSLSLTSDGQVHFEANGDVIVYGQTTYTTNDGQLHIAEDVGFAVSDVHEPLDIAAIIANADAIESVTHIDQLAETASSSSLMVELGGQTYEIATLAGQELGTHDILTQFVGGDTSANLLTNKSWTDVIDIASDHGGPGAIIAAGGTLDNGSYANGEGDWTVIINSGDAKVDSTNNQITFASESAENSVTIVTADGSSHNIDNVDKIQWHG